MKRVLSIILAAALIFTFTSSCVRQETTHPISEVRVMLPLPEGTKAIVEGEAVLSTQMYLLARAYFEKLENYNTDSFDAGEYRKLLSEASEAFRVAGVFCDSLEIHADVLAQAEESALPHGQEAALELLSSSAGSSGHAPFAAVAYAAEEKSPAVRYAEEITGIFDNAKNGQKLKAIAQQYGTDVKKAKVMLEQAQAILEGAAYEDQAAFENKCYEVAVETKAAASAIGFGVGCAAVMASGGLAAASLMEGGGLIVNGVSAIIDAGTAVTVHTTNGEGNEYTAAWEKTAEMFAPVSAVFAIGGGIQNIKDFRNPGKAAEMVDNAAQAFLTGLGFGRDYVQDGTVLGISANVINGYREILVRSAPVSDREAAKEVLQKTGVGEDTVLSSGQIQSESGIDTDAYIGASGDLINPEDPFDADAFLANVDLAFTDAAASEGLAYTGRTDPAGSGAANEAEPEESSPASETVYAGPEEPAEAAQENEVPAAGGILPAAAVAGSYYFAALEDSAKINISAADGSHLMITDVDNGESFFGDYDETTGIFYAVLSDRFQWYVVIKFTNTGYGIQADLAETLGETSVTSSSMKE